MYPMPTPFDYEASMFLADQIVKACKRLWTWWLATYVKLPLIRPVRYVYYVTYSFGSPLSGPAHRDGAGWCVINLVTPVRSEAPIAEMRDLIVNFDQWGEGVRPSIVIQDWKLLHKQVYRQGAWHNTRRHPRLA